MSFDEPGAVGAAGRASRRFADDAATSRSRVLTEDVATLVAAVCYGDISLLLETPSLNPNLTDTDGCHLLHWAALNDRIDIASLLLERGANVNAVGGVLKETPFMWALRRRYFRMLDLLFSKGADLSIRNIQGNDALHLACSTGPELMVPLLYLLLHWGVDVNARKGGDGDAPLSVLAKALLPWSTRADSPTSTEAESAAALAAEVETRSAMRLLMKFGASPMLQDTEGDTVTHTFALAAQYDDLALAFDAYQCPGSENAARLVRNARGLTPYAVATQVDNEPMRRLLLDALLFNVMPVWAPTAWVAGVVYNGYLVWIWVGPFTAIVVGAATAALAFRYLLQWEIIKHRPRAFAGATVGWAAVSASVYLAVPVSLVNSMVGLALLAAACVLTLRFRRTRPLAVTGGREELLAAVLAASPRGPEDEEGAEGGELGLGQTLDHDHDHSQAQGQGQGLGLGLVQAQPQHPSHNSPSHDHDHGHGHGHGHSSCCDSHGSASSPNAGTGATTGAGAGAGAAGAPAICPTCLCDKRRATQHCLFCGHCVSGQDFHSFFFANCVAEGNRRVYYGAMLLWLLSNTHFLGSAWAGRAFVPWPLLPAALALVFNNASLLWSGAVLVAYASSFYMIGRGVRLPTRSPPGLSVAFGRLFSFVCDGAYDVALAPVTSSGSGPGYGPGYGSGSGKGQGGAVAAVRHDGGGSIRRLSRQSVLRFVASTFQKELRDGDGDEDGGPGSSNDQNSPLSSLLPQSHSQQSGIGGGDGRDGDGGGDEEDQRRGGRGRGRVAKLEALYYVLADHISASASASASGSGLGLGFGRTRDVEDPEYGVFAARRGRRGQRGCGSHGCKECEGPTQAQAQAQEQARLRVAASSESMDER